jgi:hypothetical protein
VLLEGTYYEYNGTVGFVKFCCEQQVSFCITVGDTRMQDVCVVISKDQWSKLIPVDTSATVHDLPQIPAEYGMITE